MKLATAIALLLGIIGTFGQSNRSPTRKPTSRPTPQPTTAYRKGYVPFNITMVPSAKITAISGTTADKDEFNDDIGDATIEALQRQSSIPDTSPNNGQDVLDGASSESTTFDAENEQITLAMVIQYYWDYSSEVKTALSQSSTDSDFGGRMETFIQDYFNETGAKFVVDIDKYREESGSNKLTLFIAVISMIIAMIF